MNERIQEVIKETGMYIAYENSAVTTKELEYFAEQIIQECIEVVNSHRSKLDSGPTYIMQSIKEHFGV